MDINLYFGDTSENIQREEKGCSLFEIPADYTLLDLETTGLDPTWNEIIEIGAIRVRNHNIVDSFSQLVKPSAPIDDFISTLTGITNEMVADAPTVEDVLPTFFEFVGNDVVVGHNVNFDINFLYDNCVKFLSHGFTNDYVDTMRLSRRLFPEERHHRLSDLEQRFNLQNETIHRALSDVMLTYQCLNILRQHVIENNIDLQALLLKSSNTLSAKDIVANTNEFDENSPFYQKVFVFTGTLERMPRKDAMQIVVNLGGICGDGVNKKTNYLVLGNNDFCSTIKGGKSSKHKKAEQLQLSGQDIEIISENVFYDMIDNS